MFELPDAKRVRREDLFNDGDSTRPSSPDLEAEAAIQARLRAKLSNLISVDFGSPTEETKAPEPDEIEDEGVLKDQIRDTAEPEFEFRLFSSTAPQKIVLAPADGTGKIDENGSGIVEPRPLSYYIRGELSPEQREQFAAAAVTAADILQGAKQRAWGLEVPWRVTKITIGPSSSGDQKRGGNQTGGSDGIARGKKRKGKLGKKARIATRTKQKALLELEKQKMTKEEHLKEKRKRLNREKKLKRRQKEKEKKAASAGGVETGTGEMKVGGDGDESMSEVES